MKKVRKFGQEWHLYSLFVFWTVCSIIILNSPIGSTPKVTGEAVCTVFCTFLTLSNDWKSLPVSVYKIITAISLAILLLWCLWVKYLFFAENRAKMQPELNYI